MDRAALAALAETSAYPLDPSASAGIRRIDTHISHVFLTGERAYKFRRPVRLAFLDFSDARERERDCLREVALNRRLAPDVYLGVAALRGTGADLVVGDTCETLCAAPDVVEHCVVMRRLAAGRDLSTLLAAASVGFAQVDAIAAVLAAFHALHGLGVPAPFAAEDWIDVTTAPARANFDALLGVDPAIVDHQVVRQARELAARFVIERREQFEERRRRGRVIDGHGDLHTEHIWFETDDSSPLIVDCLEFREDFRLIDAASDVAFLAMDLIYRGHPELACRFLRRYARDSGDFQLFGVVDYFAGYRALVRAKVAALVAADPTIPAERRSGAASSTRRHLDLGLALLAPRRPGSTLLMCGLIGCGKTTVAETLADLLGAVVISSDRVRKERAGLTAGESLRNEYGSGAYHDDSRAHVYADLLEEARAVVRSGRTVILDATYAKRAWRQQAQAWAAREGSPCSLIEVTAHQSDVLTRLHERSTRGGDASDAGPELYEAMRAQFEEPSAQAKDWPAQRHFTIDTSDSGWREAARNAAATLTGAIER